MRALWTQEVVNFKGRYHEVNYAGINPLPVQRPIPIWFGGDADRVMRRLARIGDGWITDCGPDAEGEERIGQMREYAREAGRDPMSIGVEGLISLENKSSPDDWHRDSDAWEKIGATHLSVDTMKAGLKGPDQHIEAIRRFKEAFSI